MQAATVLPLSKIIFSIYNRTAPTTPAPMVEEKPFADVKRRCHSDYRYSGMHGQTARRDKHLSYKERKKNSLSRDHPPNSGKARSYAYLDASAGYATSDNLRSRLTQPYLLTNFELDGGDSFASLDRRKAWDLSTALLEKYAVGMPQVSKSAIGEKQVTYQLQAAAVILPDPDVAAAEHDLRYKIYMIKRNRPTLLYTLPTSAPAGTGHAPLVKAQLHCSGGGVKQSAIVRVNNPASAWDCGKSQGKPLDIDLGRTYNIKAFSTQGRHPATRIYPHVRYNQGVYQVEDEEHLTGQFHDAKGRYGGPRWTVLDDGSFGRGEYGMTQWRDPQFYLCQYVKRYELLWRSDGGRKWHSLGTFSGNSDSTSEVAHSMAAIQGGLLVRYLRVVPLDCANDGGAMRVGVYGTSVADVRGKAKAKHAKQSVAALPEDDEVVTYCLSQKPETMNKTFVREKTGNRKGDKNRCDDEAQSVMRYRMRKEAWEQAREQTDDK
uniref:Uncharacterized protein st1 n=1 Tax=Chrysotila carterae TaxID=13221 RepID=Q1MWL4_CHRCT|nr:hypothetical protein [Chrysotila carterae]